LKSGFEFEWGRRPRQPVTPWPRYQPLRHEGRAETDILGALESSWSNKTQSVTLREKGEAAVLAEVCWIKGIPWRLAILPRPRGGEWLEDEIRSIRAQRIEVLVSLLTPDETAELELEQEAPCCASAGIEFLSLPIEDRSVPTDERAANVLIERLASDLQHGKAVGIHCRAGIGRSALVAACVLARLGTNTNDGFRLIGQARGCTVPDTQEQAEWADRFARRLMA
jgi:protein-tyrosine phosphatase